MLLIKIGEKQGESKCALVYGQMNEPPAARARIGLTKLIVAEHFRDTEAQDVLLFINNIFRFTQADSEVSCFAWSYSLCSRLPANFSYRCWRASREDYYNQEGFHHIKSLVLLVLATSIHTCIILIELFIFHSFYATVDLMIG
ncbi:hypothetical protein RDI58_000902 [Solanum bulbocastanum]|uniref:ATP synthase subunit beta, mitochondrial n=1 Tax=Solanum bulbocastanum TaxID=147425 RepID=A0AAN8U8E4_SOLBU